MEFDKQKDSKVDIKYCYDSADPSEAQPTVVVNGDIITENNKPYLVGLSHQRNVPLKTSRALSGFEAKPIEVSGNTHYFYERKEL